MNPLFWVIFLNFFFVIPIGFFFLLRLKNSCFQLKFSHIHLSLISAAWIGSFWFEIWLCRLLILTIVVCFVQDNYFGQSIETFQIKWVVRIFIKIKWFILNHTISVWWGSWPKNDKNVENISSGRKTRIRKRLNADTFYIYEILRFSKQNENNRMSKHFFSSFGAF